MRGDVYMKDGKCPMCNSTEVYANHSVNFRASGQIVDLEDEGGEDELEATFIPYICKNCGFTAMYVEDMDDIKGLPKIKGWKKARHLTVSRAGTKKYRTRNGTQ